MSSLCNCFYHLFHRSQKTKQPITESTFQETQENPITAIVQSVSHRPADQPVQLIPTSQPQGLWQTAYKQLNQTQRQLLSIDHKSIEPGDENDSLRSSINQVIQTTEEENQQYLQTADGNFHKASRKIVNAALLFKDIIGAVAALDPTQHAASVWNIISLGLTMAERYSESREALFRSSEYLAEILTYGAFVEKNFHERRNAGTNSRPIEEALIRLYKAILCYTAQIQQIHDASIGQKVLNTVTNNLQQSLTTLQTVAENERVKLNQWISLDHYLRIDTIADHTDQLRVQSYLDKLIFAEGASFDSYTDQHEDLCLPDTRTDLLKQISMWARSEGPFIFWLNGGAGTGKSTIARTVAQSFQQQGLLGATFFFKRGEADRGNSKYFISTLTRQLVNRHPELKNEVLHAVQTNSEIMTKSLRIQFKELLYQPLAKLHPAQIPTIIIIIDALDECDGDSDLQLILDLLFEMQNIKSVHLRVFLTSRPELPIRHGFNHHRNHRDLILHELPKPTIEHDLRVFFEYKLSKIQHNHDSLPPNWPGNEKKEKLVQMAIPLFIFAATLCRFIGDKDWLPDSRLTAVLNDEAAATASDMDRTYIPVLNQLLISKNERDTRQLLQEFHDIIGVITLLANPLSVRSLAQLISVSEDVISNRLNKFHAVLHVPGNLEVPVRMLHLSFRDFLVSTETRFRIQEQETHARIVSHCFRLMKAQLKQNICKLKSYGTQQENIEPRCVNKYITADLKYACSYWVHHLEQSKGLISDSDILSFLREHILHWLEALALVGQISEAVRLISTLQSRIWISMNTELSDFLYDADRFVRQNSYVAGIAPLQLYCAGLLFAPNRSIIKNAFHSKVIGQQIQLTGVEESWSRNLQTFEGHSSTVTSVAFSPDGRTLASGSADNTIKLWDPATGVEQRTLTGHSNTVTSVAFSPDGRTLASGSWDNTIKLWDPATGVEQRTLKGHSNTVYSVAFSPDGRTLASGSRDDTIKLWDPATGVEQRTLTGHSGTVYSVAFSPDGRTLASGSADDTIKLWDPATGVEQRTLTGHSSFVTSVFNEFTTSYSISVADSWVSLRDERLLWLPTYYRSFRCFAIKDTTLVLGLPDGCVPIIRIYFP